MGVCGNVYCVATVVKDSCFFILGVLKYVVCLCKACDGYRCSCMGSVSVSSYRCCMFVSCVHYVSVRNGTCMHDLQFVNASRGWKKHTPEPVS